MRSHQRHGRYDVRLNDVRLLVLDRADATGNFEDLTDLGDGRVMIVSDDGGKSGRGTPFTVLQRKTAAD